jgi:hypothetical protein
MAEQITIPFVLGTAQFADQRIAQLAGGSVIQDMLGLKIERDGRIEEFPGWTQMPTIAGNGSVSTVFSLDDKLCVIANIRVGFYPYPTQIAWYNEALAQWFDGTEGAATFRGSIPSVRQLLDLPDGPTQGTNGVPHVYRTGALLYAVSIFNANGNRGVTCSLYHKSVTMNDDPPQLLKNVTLLTGILPIAFSAAPVNVVTADTLVMFMRDAAGVIAVIRLSLSGVVPGVLDIDVPTVDLLGGADANIRCIAAVPHGSSTARVCLVVARSTGLTCYLYTVTSTAITLIVSASFAGDSWFEIDAVRVPAGPDDLITVVGRRTSGTTRLSVCAFRVTPTTVTTEAGITDLVTPYAPTGVSPLCTIGFDPHPALVVTARDNSGSLMAWRLTAARALVWAAPSPVGFAAPAGTPHFAAIAASPGTTDVVQVPAVVGLSTAAGNEPRWALVEFRPNQGPTYEATLDPGLSLSNSIGLGGEMPRSARQANATEYWLTCSRQVNDERNTANMVTTFVHGGGFDAMNVSPVDGGAVVAGGVPMFFDSCFSHELGWLGRPVVTAEANGGGGSLVTGAYQAQALWRAVDARGRFHRSGPSLVKPWSASAGNTRILTITGPVTWRRPAGFAAQLSFQEVVTEAYRTIASGSVLIHETSGPSDLTGLTSNLTLTVSDANLQGTADFERQLLTRQMYVPNQTTVETGSPVPFRFSTWANQRLWSGGLPDPRQIQVSKPLEVGVPLEHAGPGAALWRNFFTQIPEPATGIAALDERVVAFSREGLFLIDGLGPDRNGNGEFNPPIRLAAPTGTLSQRTVLETELGVFYQESNSGRIMLLPRGFGSPEWVSEPIRDTLRGRTVRAAAVNKNKREATFALDSGLFLVFDFRNKQWSTHNPPVAGSVRSLACDSRGRLVAVVNGDVWREDNEEGFVGTRSITFKSLALADVLGWSQVDSFILLASFLSTGTLQLFYSFDDFTTAPLNLGTRTVVTGQSEYKWQLNWRRCARVAFLLVISGAARVCRLHAMALEGERSINPVRDGVIG